MRIGIFGIALLTVAAVAFVAGAALTDDEAPEDPNAAWMAMGTPGEHHAWLGRFAGTWTVEARFWEGPGEPTTSQGRAELTSEWDGRYLQMAYEGEFGGGPFNGRGTWAYNNGMERFEGTWIDSWSTAIAFSTGQREGDVLTTTSEIATPMGPIQARDVVTYENENRWTMASYWSTPQGEQKTMELVYTRAE